MNVNLSSDRASKQQGDEPGPLFLVDGNNLAYRAYFALPPEIATSTGFPTNALYGFSSMLLKIVGEFHPQVVVVAWDSKEKTFRHELFESYKAQRPPMPEALQEQWPFLEDIAAAFGFVNVSLPGYEADDILATLARQVEREGGRAVIVTGDRDALQLVTDRVQVMASTRGISEVRIYDPRAVYERFGVTPAQIPDYIGLKGDSSDNIPGVPGIGEKTAAALLAEYSSLEAVLEHANDIGATKRRESLLACREQALAAKELATLRREAPIDIHAPELRAQRVDKQALAELFTRLEFNSLLERLEQILPPEQSRGPGGGTGQGGAESEELTARALSPHEIERNLDLSLPAAVVPAPDGERLFVAQEGAQGTRLFEIALSETVRPALRSLFGACGIICHHFKADSVLPSLVERAQHDTLLGGYLLAPGRRSYELPDLASEMGLDAIAVGESGPARARLLLEVAARQKRLLREQGMWDLFQQIELPLTRVLIEMETVGVKVDTGRLGEIAAQLQNQLEGLEDEIYELAGGPFNLGSPQQLAEVLYDRLSLPRGRKTKTGHSTDAKTLEALRPLHPIVDRILSYRELSKLLSTYLLALPAAVRPETQRLHTTFHQAVTATGRLSSSDPNLQNIPVRTDLGAQIRECFVAEEGCLLLVADYSQIELRLMAYLAEEPALLDSFRRGEDIHARTAAEVFGLAESEVEPIHRRYAKAVNFGILYGISPFGLAQQLGIEREQAAMYIDRYFERLPRVRAFIDSVIATAREQGYVATIFGRRRYIPELHSANFQTRLLGERLAINSVIQGSAADIIKVAMIRCRDRLRAEVPAAHLVLQIHDELLFEMPAEAAQKVRALVEEEMVGALPMDPPLAVETGIGTNWLAAK